MFPFKEPQQDGDRFTAEDAQNRRLIVVPIEYVPEIRTARGDVVDGIRLNVVDLDDPEGPKTYFGTIWFGGRLIRTFRNSIGDGFCGFVSKVQTQGGFRAWQFSSLTGDEVTMKMAAEFFQANPDFVETCQGDVNLAKSQVQGSAPVAPPAPPAQPSSFPVQSPQPPPVAPVQSPLGSEASGSPAPVNESVMERLRRQRDEGAERVRSEHQQQNRGSFPF